MPTVQDRITRARERGFSDVEIYDHLRKKALAGGHSEKQFKDYLISKKVELKPFVTPKPAIPKPILATEELRKIQAMGERGKVAMKELQSYATTLATLPVWLYYKVVTPIFKPIYEKLGAKDLAKGLEEQDKSATEVFEKAGQQALEAEVIPQSLAVSLIVPAVGSAVTTGVNYYSMKIVRDRNFLIRHYFGNVRRLAQITEQTRRGTAKLTDLEKEGLEKLQQFTKDSSTYIENYYIPQIRNALRKAPEQASRIISNVRRRVGKALGKDYSLALRPEKTQIPKPEVVKPTVPPVVKPETVSVAGVGKITIPAKVPETTTPAKQIIPKFKPIRVTIIPQKKKFIVEVEEAVKKAPEIKPVDTKEYATFKIDGRFKILNNKESLNKFLKEINKTPEKMAVGNYGQLTKKGIHKRVAFQPQSDKYVVSDVGGWTDGRLLDFTEDAPKAVQKFPKQTMTKDIFFKVIPENANIIPADMRITNSIADREGTEVSPNPFRAVFLLPDRNIVSLNKEYYDYFINKYIDPVFKFTGKPQEAVTVEVRSKIQGLIKPTDETGYEDLFVSPPVSEPEAKPATIEPPVTIEETEDYRLAKENWGTSASLEYWGNMDKPQQEKLIAEMKEVKVEGEEKIAPTYIVDKEEKLTVNPDEAKILKEETIEQKMPDPEPVTVEEAKTQAANNIEKPVQKITEEQINQLLLEKPLTSRQKKYFWVLIREAGLYNQRKEFIRKMTGERTGSIKEVDQREFSDIIKQLMPKEKVTDLISRFGEPPVVDIGVLYDMGRELADIEKYASPYYVIPEVWSIFRSANKNFWKDFIDKNNKLTNIKTSLYEQLPDVDERVISLVADGKIPLEKVDPIIQESVRQVDGLMAYAGDKAGVPPEKWLNRYFPHVFPQDLYNRWTKTLTKIQRERIASALKGTLKREGYQQMSGQERKVLKNIIRTVVDTSEIPEDQLKRLPKAIFSPHMIERKGKPGYRLDYFDVDRLYLYRMLRKAYFDKALDKMRPIVAGYSSSRARYASLWTEVILGKWRPSRAIKIAKLIPSVYYRTLIGGAIDTMIQNLGQPLLGTIPLVGVKNTLIGYSKLLTKKGRLSIKEARLLSHYQQMLRTHIYRVNPNVKNLFGAVMSKIDNILFTPMAIGEYINRGASYHAGIEHYTKGGKPFNEAMRLAFKFSDKTAQDFGELTEAYTQYLYGSWGSSPYLYTSPIYRTLPFTSFPIKTAELEFYNAFAKQSDPLRHKIWQTIKLLIGLGITTKIFGEVWHFKRYSKLRVSPTVDDATDFISWISGDPGAGRRLEIRWKRNLPLRYVGKLRTALDIEKNNGIMRDEEGDITAYVNPLELVGWLAGVRPHSFEMKQKMMEDINFIKQSRRVGYNFAYEVLKEANEEKNPIKRDKLYKKVQNICRSFNLDPAYVNREYLEKNQMPTILRRAKKLPLSERYKIYRKYKGYIDSQIKRIEEAR